MDLVSHIVRDFVNRSRDELELLDQGLVEWRATPDDPEKLTYLAEILQSLQEMSGLLVFPELENLFHGGHTVLLMARQQWPQPCLDVMIDWQELIKKACRLLSEIESRQNGDPTANHAGDAIAPSRAHLVQPSGPPSPFRQRESLRGPVYNLTDFIVENLADPEENTGHDSDHIGVRLVQLIDEAMAARHQIRQIFAHAVSLTSERDRSAFLDQACATCPELRLSLERLLKSESQSQWFVQFPAPELIRALLETLRSEVLQPLSHGPTVELTVPDDGVFEQNVESTVHVRPSSAFVLPVAEESTVDPAAFPRPFGRYTLERELSHDAMGTVFLAFDRLVNRQVALKLLRMKPDDGQEIVELFYREARSMVSLQHTNLCPIYDFGEVDGQPYLTMALINGRPLSDDLVGGHPLVTRYAVTLVRTLATALHEAHQMGTEYLEDANRVLLTSAVDRTLETEAVERSDSAARPTQPWIRPKRRRRHWRSAIALVAASESQ